MFAIRDLEGRTSVFNQGVACTVGYHLSNIPKESFLLFGIGRNPEHPDEMNTVNGIHTTLDNLG